MRVDKKSKYYYRLNRQNGLSLIELMIAMLIGIFLLAGISKSYIDSKNASTQTNQISVLEDNGRYALETITNILEKTGYTPINAEPIPSQFITDNAEVIKTNCTDGSENVVDESIIDPTENGSGSSSSDTLATVFHGDSGHFTDCTGNTLPLDCRLLSLPGVNTSSEAARIYNSFSVDNDNSTLNCSGSRSGASEVIAEGVENIQFLYGLDTIDDGQVTVDRYVNASDVAGLWNNVVSVQVAILVRSLKEVRPKPVSKTFTLLDTVVTSPSDRYQRQVFSTTVKLRNTL